MKNIPKVINGQGSNISTARPEAQSPSMLILPNRIRQHIVFNSSVQEGN